VQTAQKALAIAVLFVPGLLLATGYSRARARASRPEIDKGDLIAIAQTIVLSMLWLPVLWSLGGHKIVDWLGRKDVADHPWAIGGLILLNLGAPFIAGLLAGQAVDKISSRPSGPLARVLRWTGMFEPQTVWDAAWRRAIRAEWAAVEIRLKDDTQYNVLFDSTSTVGLTPAPRHLFFSAEYRWHDGEPEVVEHAGVYIDATDVVSLRFEHLEGAERGGPSRAGKTTPSGRAPRDSASLKAALTGP
jgi:Family of unknown function (DUF6338)